MMNQHEIIPTTAVVIPTPAIDYTKPLDPELKAVLNQELDALSAKPANGWDATYPTLYNTLNAIVTEYAAAMNCPKPALVLEFTGVNACQARAEVMTDGSTRMYIGTGFIRALLLSNNEAHAPLLHRSFRWTIAHEMAHLADPTLRWWAKMFKVRVFIKSMARVQLTVGLVSFFLSFIPAFAQVPFHVYLYLGAGLNIFYFLFELGLHHMLEYHADIGAMKTADHFSVQEPVCALTAMNDAIAIVAEQEADKARAALDDVFALMPDEKQTAFLKMQYNVRLALLSGRVFKEKFFRNLYHPSYDNRIAAIEKLQAKAS